MLNCTKKNQSGGCRIVNLDKGPNIKEYISVKKILKSYNTRD